MIIHNGIYTVYIHNFPNGKRYVGITSQDVEKRWHQDGSGYKGQMVYNAIQKYGWDNIFHEIFASNLTKEEAINMEKLLIQKLQTNNIQNGYNLTIGGEGYLNLDYEKVRKLWEQGYSTKEISCLLNKKYSQINYTLKRIKISIAEKKARNFKDRKNYFSPEITQAIIIDYKNFTPKVELAQKYKCSIPAITTVIQKYDLPSQFEINQYDIQGNFIKKYSGVFSATKELFPLDYYYKHNSIIACLQNKANSAYGFIWIYTLKEKQQEELAKKILAIKSKNTGVNRIIGQYDFSGNLIQIYTSIAKATDAVGLKSSSSILRVLTGNGQSAGGYKWKYLDDKKSKISAKAVAQYDQNNHLIKIFPSANLAAKEMNVKSPSHILECCRGKRKTFHSFFWRFAIAEGEI